MLFFQCSRRHRVHRVSSINHNASLEIYSALGSSVDSSPERRRISLGIDTDSIRMITIDEGLEA